MIQLSARQLEIIRIVQRDAPITGEQIADQLGTARPTIRSDLSLLVMLEYIDAKPKVGYFPVEKQARHQRMRTRWEEVKVKDVQGVPIIVRETTTVNDAVVTLFLENVGSLIVADEEGNLLGMVTRKDLLKMTLGNSNAATMPLSMLMTRAPNVVTVSPEDSVIEAVRRMIDYEVNSLPVVSRTKDEDGKESTEIVGRISKTTITKMVFDFHNETL